jgi:hypothetical protein
MSDPIDRASLVAFCAQELSEAEAYASGTRFASDIDRCRERLAMFRALLLGLQAPHASDPQAFIWSVGAAFDESTGCQKAASKRANLWCYWPNSDPAEACEECQRLYQTILKFAAGGLQAPPADKWRQLGDLLKTGGRYDPDFLIGQVEALLSPWRAV